ncbi:unnamed protein product [Vitrella brassicaformis CCMP3155]|uniref:Uncharacterized protein n=1 Tax=Vitrella brassicaformis (strain CCMP3155) TaxID=1169540 RepID=A0A0G4EM39_VITBC|nr:unnamed protein product [Vitrella brassicaformis CCMP3155]|eukprot:CEL98213.1 unnamed protein product [Vitrella brassicaformis CCMP3155]
MPQSFHAWPQAFFFLMRFAYVMGAQNPDMMPLPQPMTEEYVKTKKEPTCRRRPARGQGNRAMDQEQGAAAAPQQEPSSASGSDAHVGWSVRDETSVRRMWTASGGQVAPDDSNGNQDKKNDTTGSKVGLPHDASKSASSSAAAASASASVSRNKTSRLQRVTLREHELPMARAPVAEKMASVLAEKIKNSGPSVVCNNKHANAKYNNGI